MPTTHGSALWQGGIKDGKGAISTKSGALKEYPYGFASRFEGKPGTNPEELIGAAHAGCFTMALSLILGEAKLTAERMDTTAEVTLEKVADDLRSARGERLVILLTDGEETCGGEPATAIAIGASSVVDRPFARAHAASCTRISAPSTVVDASAR